MKVLKARDGRTGVPELEGHDLDELPTKPGWYWEWTRGQKMPEAVHLQVNPYGGTELVVNTAYQRDFVVRVVAGVLYELITPAPVCPFDDDGDLKATEG